MMMEFLQHVREPRILEIGVDRGQTLIPLVFYLTHNKERFNITGVDVRIDETLALMLHYTGLLGSPYLSLHHENSLTYLEREKGPWDLILVDGDHNYFTVSKELELLKERCHPGTLVIVDDYHGRWAERDLFYAERDTHKGNALATAPVETEKKGVKAAVDDFLGTNPQWTHRTPLQGEPILLFMKDPNADQENPTEAR